jgi:uncharacterized protein
VGKILLLAALVVVAVFWLRYKLAREVAKTKTPDPAKSADSAGEHPKTRAMDQMVQCAWCGVHLPASEALSLADGRLYCSEEHRALGASKQP